MHSKYTPVFPSGALRGAILPIVLLLGLGSSTMVHAWGNTGHEAVACAAWRQLNPAVQSRVLALLKLVPTVHPAPNKSVPG